jgi:hypothetical protein
VSDGEDLRVDWVADHWLLGNGGGPTAVVPAALLTNRPQAAPGASAPSDPGEGGFSPFTAEAASASEPAPAADGLPWTAIGVGVALLVALASVVVMRRREAR